MNGERPADRRADADLLVPKEARTDEDLRVVRLWRPLRAAGERVSRHTLAAARDAMRVEYEGLCALVNEGGPCCPCRVLRDVAPEGRRGAELPDFPLAFEDRLVRLRSKRSVDADENSRMNDYFFGSTRAMQQARG